MITRSVTSHCPAIGWPTNRAFLAMLVALCALILPESLWPQRVTPSKKSPAACELTSEDYAVYSAILQRRGKPADPEEGWAENEKPILSESTIKGGTFFRESKRLWSSGFSSPSTPEPAKETELDFGKKLIGPICLVRDNITYLPGYSLLPLREIENIFDTRHDGWQEFYRRYPHSSGLWSFSRVGYNVAKTEALVYLVHSCGMLCGTGHLYLLQKQDEGWMVKNKLMLWIS